ncbi:hypothetical protein SNEBB_004648 [Seison nebaliae]|nr:hypothetical protein SNEBB_004648 [Seison nebaliae]
MLEVHSQEKWLTDDDVRLMFDSSTESLLEILEHEEYNYYNDNGRWEIEDVTKTRDVTPRMETEQIPNFRNSLSNLSKLPSDGNGLNHNYSQPCLTNFKDKKLLCKKTKSLSSIKLTKKISFQQWTANKKADKVKSKKEAIEEENEKKEKKESKKKMIEANFKEWRENKFKKMKKESEDKKRIEEQKRMKEESELAEKREKVDASYKEWKDKLRKDDAERREYPECDPILQNINKNLFGNKRLQPSFINKCKWKK